MIRFIQYQTKEAFLCIQHMQQLNPYYYSKKQIVFRAFSIAFVVFS